ncbi:MAG: ABC transporter ATP-binding protein [Firmicutes bacterium]|nr:ABC transporter ATP-binding protein [Bacillota bacterium]
MNEIRLENIQKAFGKKVALDDVSLEITKGTFTCVLGPPGAGKTTLLRIIAGLERADRGRIIIDGVDVGALPPAERGISFVAQDFALYPHMNVYKNIAYPLKLKKMDPREIDKKVREVAEFLKIEKLLDRNPEQLSGGEQQRVAIARGLVKDAALYLFDEPLTNLDYKIREDMRAEFRKIQQETGQTIIYATSDSVEAISMSQHLVVMNEGIVVEYGNTLKIYNRPNQLFTARYFGYPPMNLIPARVQKETSLETNYFSIAIPPELGKQLKGMNLTAAIRPESLQISQDGMKNKSVVFDSKVLLTDIIGSDTIVHLEGEKGFSDRIRAFVPRAYNALPGTPIKAGFDIKDLYIYDAQAEKLLWKGDV